MLKSFCKYLVIGSLFIQPISSFAGDFPNQDATYANNIVLIGPPASGKGTQANAIVKKFGIPQISTGDLLRTEAAKNTPEALALKATMASGQLVPDETVLNLLKERLSQPDAQQGFILDGFPRNQAQAKKLEEMGLNIHHVIVLEVPDKEIIRRIAGRRIHPASGRTYHVDTNPPKVAGKDDVTGEPLIQRDDDTETAIAARLKLYREQTLPVVEYYKDQANKGEKHIHVFIIDSTQPIKDVQNTILTVLEH